MIGKASEIETVEMWYNVFEDWQQNNPQVEIIDIKYALGADDRAAVLVIFKKGDTKDA